MSINLSYKKSCRTAFYTELLTTRGEISTSACYYYSVLLQCATTTVCQATVSINYSCQSTKTNYLSNYMSSNNTINDSINAP